VEKASRCVGQLQWKYNFGNKFKGPRDTEGNVHGIRWCTGTLIEKNIFITAGHCFAREVGISFQMPEKNGVVISNGEIAKLMKVNFNYQIDVNTRQIRTDTIDYPIDTLIEWRNDSLDYAIIILGKDKNGKYPGEVFGFVEVAKTDPKQDETVAIIQHPGGQPKMIEAGTIRLNLTNRRSIEYDDIDTKNKSSGSALISSISKRIVGIHVEGGCDNSWDGSNHATPISFIMRHSKLIKSLAK
jgi:V8-like Glu-specific endopeptidase